MVAYIVMKFILYAVITFIAFCLTLLPKVSLSSNFSLSTYYGSMKKMIHSIPGIQNVILYNILRMAHKVYLLKYEMKQWSYVTRDSFAYSLP